MSLTDLRDRQAGAEAYVLGNEAVARGAVEAGIWLASCYPGTPSSEISDTLSELSKDFGFEFEYSANEKVAAEVAAGVAIAGGKSMVIFKGAGFFVASDALFHLAYSGVKGAYVIAACDEPGLHSSSDEIDMRMMGRIGFFPTFVPSTVQEAKSMTIEAFRLSQEIGQPVMLRMTTRVCQQRGFIQLGEVPKHSKPVIQWDTDEPWAERFVLFPPNARAGRLRMLEAMKKAEDVAEDSEFNQFLEEDSDLGLLTCGVAHGYALEAMRTLNVKASIFKLGISFPLPEKGLRKFLAGLKRLFVIEESEPYLEERIRGVAQEANPVLKIYGKENGFLPRVFDYDTTVVVKALGKALNLDLPVDYSEIEKRAEEAHRLPFPRPPVLCAGCPHRATAYAIRRATKGKAAFSTDVGCYNLATHPPLNIGATVLCMGTSIGIACGLNYFIDKPIVSTIGDSTFFHAGLPGLVNAVYNQVNFTLIVMDNSTTGMTGFQPNPGVGIRGGGKSGTRVIVENVAKGMGVQDVKVVDSYNIKEVMGAVRDSIDFHGPSVIVSRRKCALEHLREMSRRGLRVTSFFVDSRECNGCWLCIDRFGCPAIEKEGEVARIVTENCTGCGVCAQICPAEAVLEDEKDE